MRYPRLNRNASTKVTIPLLDGGINTKDNATLINDNQLIDACNVWFDGQTLKTRPKVSKVSEFYFGDYWSKEVVKSFDVNYNGKDLKIDVELITETENSIPKLMVSVYDVQTQNMYNAMVDLNEGYNNRYSFRVNAYCGATTEDNDFGIYILVNYFSTAILEKGYHPKKIYKVSATGEDNLTPILSEIFHLGEVVDNENEVLTDELYKPLIYINGKGNMYSYLPITAQTEYANASIFEGKNILPSGMRFQFMTDGLSTEFSLPISNLENYCKIKIDLNGTGLALYQGTAADMVEVDSKVLEVEVKNGYTETNFWIQGNVQIYKSNEGKTLTNDTVYKSGKKYYTRNANTGIFSELTFTEGQSITGQVYEQTGDLKYSLFYMPYLVKRPIKFHFDAKRGTIGIFDAAINEENRPLVLPMGIANNIEIITYKHDFSQFEALMDMTLCELYGGSQGIYGGVRTFLAGYKNKICWSNAETPTYFSENNYVGVRDNAPVTALGKMGESLVIFKKRATYCTQAVSSDGATAEQIQSGSVVDVSTTYVYFPIYQISDECGCDLPNTVKLCLNRLVFANSDGNVYCLVTQSNSSTRNIYCISGQIRRKMFDEYNNCLVNKNAFAVVWGDYYLLLCDDNVWALNYNKDSYRYVYSYTNRTNNTSTRYFTWWYWKLNNRVVGSVTENHKLFLINYRKDIFILKENEDGTVLANSSKFKFYTDFFEVDSTESENACECYIKTKVFDFGYADRYKKIEKLFLSVGNDIPANITLTIESDKGEIYMRPLEIDCNEKGSRFTSEYGAEVRVIPNCNKVNRFSVVLNATGVMSIEKIYIFYKILSEVI